MPTAFLLQPAAPRRPLNPTSTPGPPARLVHWLGMVGTALAAIIAVWRLFPNVVRHPDAYFFSNAGDGIKNYYVVAYFMKYDSGHRFTGMNYPLGEHLNYPDLQPLVSGLGSIGQHLGLPVAAHAFGIVNGLVLASMVLAPVVLYAILRRTRLPVIYSVVFALLISFLAPQNNRLDGHMPLSYGCFVPILWYLLIRLQEAPRQTRWYVLYATACTLMGLVSAYYVAAGAFFLLAHVVVVAWQELPRRATRPLPLSHWLGSLALAGVAPLVVFRGWLWLTDPVTDRPVNPFGFDLFLASFNSVFVPIMAPFKPLWQQLFDTGEPSGEGFAYVGLVVDWVLILTLVLLARYAWRRRWRLIFRPALPAHLRVGLWAASLLLVLAMGYPFAAPSLKWLTDYAGPLRQFRSMGRFAWPFYYVAAVYAAYYLYRLVRYLQQRRAGAFAAMWLLPLLVLWGFEAREHSHLKADVINESIGADAFVEEAGNYQQLLSWANRSPADFQAILPIPYSSLGTDKIAIDGTQDAVFQGYKASLNTGLPLLTIAMSRSSVGNTLALTQLLSGDLISKPLLTRLPNQKPFLVLVTGAPLTPAEQRIISISRKLTSSGDVTLYELPLANLAATTLAAERTTAATLLPTLAPRSNGLYVSTAKGVLLQSYDQGNDRRGRLAAGSFHEPLDKFSTLYDGPVPAPADTGRYEVSVWLNGHTAYGFGNMQVKQYANGQMVNQAVLSSGQSTEISGDWVRVVVPIRVRPGTDRLEVLYENRDLLVDDLLIRPLDTDVYYYVGKGEGRRLVKNTYDLSPDVR